MSAMQSTFKILLADHHVMFRRGVRSLIQGMDGVEVVGETGDGFELLRLLRDIQPHLVIMEFSMPNFGGLKAAQEIKSINPCFKVLILTRYKDREYLYQALAAGVEGYLLLEDTDMELIAAIDTLRQGGTFISPLLSAQTADISPHRFRGGNKTPTFREWQVINLIAEGKTSKEIGEILFISKRTVHHHRAHIMKKLNVKNTTGLVQYAIQKGYVTDQLSDYSPDFD
jgi:DNA-binding NarL/FixJ family response regulator